MLFVCLPVCLSVCLMIICLSVRPSTCPLISCLSVCLHVCLCIPVGRFCGRSVLALRKPCMVCYSTETSVSTSMDFFFSSTKVDHFRFPEALGGRRPLAPQPMRRQCYRGSQTGAGVEGCRCLRCLSLVHTVSVNFSVYVASEVSRWDLLCPPQPPSPFFSSQCFFLPCY